MRSIQHHAHRAPRSSSAAFSRNTIQLTALVLAGLLAFISACSDSSNSPSAPIDPFPVIPNLLEKTSTAEGATFQGRGSATIEFKEANGRWSKRASKPFKLDATMGRAGIAALSQGKLPEAKSFTESEGDITDYLKYAAPVVATTGDQSRSPIYTGFTRTSRDSTGTLVEVAARPGSGGSPVSEIIVTRAGQRVASVKLDWKKEAGGYVLKKQTASLFRDKSDEAFAIMTVNLEVTSVDPRGLAARLARRMFRYATATVLPQPLYAQDCGWGIVETAVGFGVLVATAPATASGAGAVVWLAGWVRWTRGLTRTVAACDKQE